MIKMWIATGLFAMLAGCGGGDFEDQSPPRAGIQPVHCNDSTELCT
jgi:hypothetical protein